MSAQQIRSIQAFYQELRAANQPARLLRATDGLGAWQQIVTIRHGRPDIEQKKRYSAREIREYTREYDRVGIVPFEKAVFTLAPDEIPEIYTSDLPRAIHTAQLLFGANMPLVSLPLFRELEREVPLILGERRMPKAFWALLYRGPYFLGKDYRQIESFRQARVRIGNAAERLGQAAATNGAAVLVAHGIFNFLLAYALKRRGWTRVRKSGKSYLGVAVYVKKS